MRDLMVYARSLADVGFEPVRYYRDDTGLEADAIVELADGRWAAFEFKVSEDKVQDAVENLLRLKKKLCENKGAQTREPEFLAVNHRHLNICAADPRAFTLFQFER